MNSPNDVTLAGEVTAKLFASTTGSDCDWVVKLIDVYPQKYPEDWKLSGYELMIADEVFRGRFRKSFERPEPITPNAITPFTIDLHTANHVFERGIASWCKYKARGSPSLTAIRRSLFPTFLKRRSPTSRRPRNGSTVPRNIPRESFFRFCRHQLTINDFSSAE